MARCIGLAALLLVAAVVLACSESDRPPATPAGALPDRVTVTAGDASFEAEVSETTGERSLGLGERDSLERDAGMLFVFPGEAEHSFWMKGMRFPLDFVWISADRNVVAVTENVPPPNAGTNNELEQFDGDVETRYVLEVNAGVVAESGIGIGDTVKFEPNIDPSLAE